MTKTTEIISKSDTLRNARLFTAWYQAIPLMLNYWVGGDTKTIMAVMQNVPTAVLLNLWQKGTQARTVAATIASNHDCFKTAACRRRMMD